MTVLHICICTDTPAQVVNSLQIEVSILLRTGVAIVVLVGIQVAHIILYPKDASEVVAFVSIPSATQRSIDTLVTIGQREDATVEIVIHRLLTHQICIISFQTIFGQPTVGFILLVVSITFGVVQPYVHVPIVVEIMVQQQPCVLLHIIVGLVVVIAINAIFIGKHISARVISTAILGHLLFTGVIPCMIRLFLSANQYQAQAGISGIVARLQVVAIQIYRSPVDVSICADVAQAGIYRPMVVQQPCPQLQCLLHCSERTGRSGY